MRKLIQKCLAILLITAGILTVADAAYRRSGMYLNLELTEGTEKFKTVPESVDIAVFGPSHGRRAFLYGPQGKSMFNFCTDSQTPQYDERMMREFGGRFSRDALVILTFTYLSPFWTDTEERFSVKQGRYYRILSAENIVDVNMTKYRLHRISPLLAEDITSLIRILTGPSAPQEDAAAVRRLPPEDVEAQTRRVLADDIPIITPGLPDGNPVMMEAYREMLARCRENGWRVVLVTPPYTTAYNECLTEEIYEAFYARATELTEEFGVPYLDYSHDERFAEAYDWFYNIDHLNQYGAEVFDKIFFHDLKKAGLVEEEIL